MSYYRKKLSDKDYYLSQARRPLREGSFSRFRGVTKGTAMGIRHQIGLFTCELEAARAYNEAALRIVGDYAVLNDIPSADN